MDPLTVVRLVIVVLLIALGWQWFFDSNPLLGPWFLGRYLVWIDRDGLHWRKGKRVR